MVDENTPIEQKSIDDNIEETSSSSGGSSDGGSATFEETEEEKSSSQGEFSSEQGTGKVLAHGQGIDDHEALNEHEDNFTSASEQADEQGRSAAEMELEEPELEEEISMMEDLLEGIKLTELTGVQASRAEIDDSGNVVISPNNRTLPTTQEALDLQRQRNERFSAGRDDLPDE